MSTPIETITSSSQKIEDSSRNRDENQILAENGFYWREKANVKVLVCRALEENGFVNGFSTRLGGVSAFPENSLNLSGTDVDSPENVRENRRRFLQIFGGEYKLATVWQIHGEAIKIVEDQPDVENSETQADALASSLENVLLAVKTADCVPILVGDARTKSFAAIHAGWRGTVRSIVPQTIAKMRATFGANPRDLICAVGPAAGCENYEIGRDVIDAFSEKFPQSAHLFRATRENHAFIDLHLANKEQLLSAGVAEENIFTAPFCTMERSDLFFSYRLESKTQGKTGRLLSVIGRS